jgi:long-chain acyl-CoA synthetase
MEIRRTFDIIDLNCEKYPRKDMFGGKPEKEWTTYSTEEVRNHINWVSYGLLSMGFKRDDKIASITANKPEWNFIDMALAQTGMIHVPIYPTISSEEYAFILEHSEVKAIILGNKGIFNKVSPVAGKLNDQKLIFSIDQAEDVRSFWEIVEEGKKNTDKYRTLVEKTKNEIKPEDLVTIIYTSGTTGNSKGVMLSHKNIVSNFLSTSTLHELGYGHRAISFLPLCHVYERMMNYHFLYKGISVYYVENMGTISEAIKEIKPHIFNTVPRLLEKIYDNIIGKGKNLPWLKKQIFFWAINLGLKFGIL